MTYTYVKSQPLQMDAIKIDNIELTPSEIRRFVRLNDQRLIPSEYISKDDKVNVYTLNNINDLNLITKPHMGDFAVVYNNEDKRYNGSYIYQEYNQGNCCIAYIPSYSDYDLGQICPEHCPPNPDCPTIPPIYNGQWKAVCVNINYNDILLWNSYKNTIGQIQTQIELINNQIANILDILNNTVDQKILNALNNRFDILDNNNFPQSVKSAFGAMTTLQKNSILTLLLNDITQEQITHLKQILGIV